MPSPGSDERNIVCAPPIRIGSPCQNACVRFAHPAKVWSRVRSAPHLDCTLRFCTGAGGWVRRRGGLAWWQGGRGHDTVAIVALAEQIYKSLDVVGRVAWCSIFASSGTPRRPLLRHAQILHCGIPLRPQANPSEACRNIRHRQRTSWMSGAWLVRTRSRLHVCAT